MTSAAQLATVVRVARLRARQRQDALVAAGLLVTEVEQRLNNARATLARAERAHQAAERDFRGRPQCPQRQVLRAVTGARRMAADDARQVAAAELAEAEAGRTEARRALLREDARCEQFEALLRTAQTALRTQASSREEDEWTPRAQAA